MIDFEKNECKWYWNNDYKDPIGIETIDANVIYPVISPFWKDHTLEMTDYCFR